MNEEDVFRLLLARRDNYDITDIQPLTGRMYSLRMKGHRYYTVVVPHSFAFYELRYHIAKQVPDLVVCFTHDTVLSVPCLSLKAGCIASAYDLPMQITDVEKQRHRSKVGSQVLLGMYLCGMKSAQKIVNELPERTKLRYIGRAVALSKRKKGRPVGSTT